MPYRNFSHLCKTLDIHDLPVFLDAMQSKLATLLNTNVCLEMLHNSLGEDKFELVQATLIAHNALASGKLG